MSLSRVKTWTAEVLTASDLNAEFNNILTYLNATTGTYGGTFGASDGSVGVPGIYFSSDTDNGLYRIGTNNWAMSAGGIKIIELNSTNAIIRGTATNDSAAAGFIGEEITATVLTGAAVSLTSTTPVNITSISLTAGDWDVSLSATFNGGATTTVSRIEASISATTGTLDETTGGCNTDQSENGEASFNLGRLTLVVGPVRKSLAATTTVYGVARADFGVSTATVFGFLRARRIR